VLMPLLFGSIPVAHREDVGVASFTVRDLSGPRARAGTTVRAYEFFAASDPARARGLNRLGFIREVATIDDRHVRSTAQFGVISRDRAASRDAAEAGLDDDDPGGPQQMNVIDGFIATGSSTSQVVRVTLPGLWTRPEDLYADVRLQWASAENRDDRLLVNDPVHYERPVGFLGAIQASLQGVVDALGAGRRPRGRFTYVHDSQPFVLELTKHRVDRDHAHDYVERCVVAADAVVHRLEYRLLADDGAERESFELWTELPTTSSDDPLDAPIMPLAFEFQPRGFLRLTATRLSPAHCGRLTVAAAASP